MSTKKTYGEKLKHPKWQMRRLEILSRDNATCQLCGDTETELQVHHKSYYGEPWDAPNEALVTICKHCHALVEELKRIFSNILKIDFIFPKRVFKFVAPIKGTHIFSEVLDGNYLLARISDEVEILCIIDAQDINKLKDYLNG